MFLGKTRPRPCTCWFVLLLLALATSAQKKESPALNHDPDSAVITAADVKLFWQAYDLWLSREHGVPDKLAAVLQSEYLDKGSEGVKAFIPGRIVSADHLARTVLSQRAYFEGVRRYSGQMESYIPEIRKGLRGLRKLYPEASFAAVYFVIGATNSGGTSSRHALIIGSEMFGQGDGYPVQLSDVVPMVIHELVHFQQKGNDDTLLKAAMREGAADFVSEMVSGRHINERNKAYADSHEQELWLRFQRDIAANHGIGSWMYDGHPKDGTPRDLGYYMGYKICQSYYQISKDKAAALRTIVEMKSPEQILKDSKYGERFQ